jgi:riboflavin kinase
LEPKAFKGKIEESEEGVYIAWAQVIKQGSPTAVCSPVHKALVSIGWNPAYDNKEKTVEAYICEDFADDFYGAEMRLLIVGYMRPQAKFSSEDWLSELKSAIRVDVEEGCQALDDVPWNRYADDDLFKNSN